MILHLISFKTCPFVQRAVITLNQKKIEHDITYIDLADPPGWFQDISPLQKVPVLKVDDGILFESAVINEFLDDITGGDLQPKNSFQRAENRAWIEMSSEMLVNQYQMKNSADSAGYRHYRDLLITQLVYLEAFLGNGPWFNGADFSLADTAFAPWFMRDAVLDGRFSLMDIASMPKLDAWAKRLLALPIVQNSVVPEFEILYLKGIEKANSYFWQTLVQQEVTHG